MNIGIRLHDTEPGSLKERLAFARAQGFSCAHVALSKVLDDFAMEDAPEKLTDEYARHRLRKSTKHTCASRQRSAPGLWAQRPMPTLNQFFQIR